MPRYDSYVECDYGFDLKLDFTAMSGAINHKEEVSLSHSFLHAFNQQISHREWSIGLVKNAVFWLGMAIPGATSPDQFLKFRDNSRIKLTTPSGTQVFKIKDYASFKDAAIKSTLLTSSDLQLDNNETPFDAIRRHIYWVNGALDFGGHGHMDYFDVSNGSFFDECDSYKQSAKITQKIDLGDKRKVLPSEQILILRQLMYRAAVLATQTKYVPLLLRAAWRVKVNFNPTVFNVGQRASTLTFNINDIGSLQRFAQYLLDDVNQCKINCDNKDLVAPLSAPKSLVFSRDNNEELPQESQAIHTSVLNELQSRVKNLCC